MKKFIFIFITLFSISSLHAQEPIDSVSESISRDSLNNSSAIDSVPDSWSVVSLSGKLKMRGLPLSPSVKIFMKKDSLIDISFRAPLVGEAGRMIVTPDSVVAVNKMNKTYMKEGVADFLKYYPGNISNVQDLLLARFFLPGFDIREDNLEDLIDIIYEDEQFNVIPKGEAEISGITYGFVVDKYFNPLTLVILPESRPDIEIDAFFTYSDSPESFSFLPLSPYNIQLVYQEGSKALEINLELKQPDRDAQPPKPLEISNKFRSVTLSDFLRSF